MSHHHQSTILLVIVINQIIFYHKTSDDDAPLYMPRGNRINLCATFSVLLISGVVEDNGPNAVVMSFVGFVLDDL